MFHLLLYLCSFLLSFAVSVSVVWNKNAGFGTYAAVDIPAGGILVSSTLSAIPVYDAPGVRGQHWPGKDYVWSGSAFAKDIDEYIQGYGLSFLYGLFGSLANAHTGITNLGMGEGRRDPMLDRRVDAGAGAFSPYVDTGFYSRYPIAAGEELFVSYGEHW